MIGKPKFKIGDDVQFTISENKYIGKIRYINPLGIDPCGAFDDTADVSYDIMVENFDSKKKKVLFKHVSEKIITFIDG